MINRVKMVDGVLNVPDNPVIPYIEGDGIGCDIWQAAQSVFDAAVKKAYGNSKKIEWREVLAGGKAFDKTGQWLPQETEDSFKDYLIGIKGPLMTPVGGGIRSLNVTLRQNLDLFVCLRPVSYYSGIETPVKEPQKVDIVVFRENTEDVYAGFEVASDDPRVDKLKKFLKDEMDWDIKGETGLGIKPMSKESTERLVIEAIKFALKNKRKVVTLVHKGNIMKFTEGAFRNWGYEVALREFPNQVTKDPNDSSKLLINDCIADAFLQNILLKPEAYDVVATLNLNGDYCSDALAAQVGGIGISPGANINYHTGVAIFEATHGTAPDIAGKNMANPSSIILSGKMMFEYMGWQEAANLIEKGVSTTISSKRVTGDLASMMSGDPETLGTNEYAKLIIQNM
ncbi:NADP-dependent isocitrate dehydrogenase [Thiospirochaeta perfilievii]|uniref:isocitrate dehydrogenase (NADP(+)) n=1 Tax=Thiospirochaeta perfilievii TaxID=252967 RepID=A0A5C1Q8V9_9SPIO|nr:NADP-dependent isocitrate dehydrogenase [Thiospirochaeta perfilievii]QEN03941.1 NADP-dependent isocitrate dehydrogenase [Thiospirochaeta perfilievii]